MSSNDAISAIKGGPSPTAARPTRQDWPEPLPERVRAVRAALARHAGPVTSDEMAGQFVRARKTDVAELLETLVTVGQARRTEDGRYAP